MINFKKMMAYPEANVFIPLVVIILIVGLIKPVFFTASNITSILCSVGFLTVIAIGQTLVLISGEIDLSVGAVAGFSGIVMTWLMSMEVPTVVAIILGLAACACVGIINGILVARVRLNSFIVTIGMLYVAKGFGYVLTKGNPIFPIPDSINNFGAAKPLGISWPFFIAIFLVLVFNFILRKTVFGRKLFAVGDNREVAILAGIHVEKVKIAAYVLSALLAGITGLFMAATIHAGDPTVGQGWELQSVAATAVGGISLAGGAGSMIGTLIGVCIMNVLNNALVLLSLPSQAQPVALGLVMIAAVAVDIFRRSRKTSA
jgi:ribose transport system permease protein